MLRKIILCSLIISLFLGGEGFAKPLSEKKVVRITVYTVFTPYIAKDPKLELIITDNKIQKPIADYFYHGIELENLTLTDVPVVNIDYPYNLFNQIPTEFTERSSGSYMTGNGSNVRMFIILFTDGSYSKWSIFDDSDNSPITFYGDITSEKGVMFLDEIDRILYDGCKFLPVGKAYKWRKYCQ